MEDRFGEILVPTDLRTSAPDDDIVSLDSHGFEAATGPDAHDAKPRNVTVRPEEWHALEPPKRNRCASAHFPVRHRIYRFLPVFRLMPR